MSIHTRLTEDEKSRVWLAITSTTGEVERRGQATSVEEHAALTVTSVVTMQKQWGATTEWTLEDVMFVWLVMQVNITMVLQRDAAAANVQDVAEPGGVTVGIGNA